MSKERGNMDLKIRDILGNTYALTGVEKCVLSNESTPTPIVKVIYKEGTEPNMSFFNLNNLIYIDLYERDADTDNDDNLCNSCSDASCMFQSGVVRKKCSFYKQIKEEQK